MKFRDIGIYQINLIKELWEDNTRYHLDSLEHFNEEYHSNAFQNRVTSWQGSLYFKVTISESDSGINAYIISIIKDGIGIIESIFVKKENRGKGIGRNLLLEHLKWFRQIKAKKVTVTTVYGNNSAIEFYKSMGLYPKSVVLELK